MSTLDIATLADKIDAEEAEQARWAARYPGSKLVRSAMGILPADVERGCFMWMPKFENSRRGQDSWEQHCADNRARNHNQNQREIALVRAACGPDKPASPVELRTNSG